MPQLYDTSCRQNDFVACHLQACLMLHIFVGVLRPFNTEGIYIEIRHWCFETNIVLHSVTLIRHYIQVEIMQNGKILTFLCDDDTDVPICAMLRRL